MSSAQDGPADPGDGPAGRRPPTLDLQATEVAAETPAPEPAAPAEAVPPPPPETPAAPESPAPAREDPPPAERRRPWRLAGLALGAGAGAAAGAAALLAAAWLGGIPLGRDEQAGETAARLAALEAQVRTLAAQPPAAPAGRIEELATRLAAAEQAFGAVKQLEARLAKVEAALAQPATDADLARRVAALEETAKTLTAALAQAQARIGELAGRAPVAAPDTGKLTADLGALAARVQALEETAKALQAARPALDRDRAARRAVAALALNAAVAGGAPFAAELAALRAADPGVSVAALEPFAATGVPAWDALRRELAQLAPAPAPAEADNAPQGGSFWERLQAGAAKLIRIRRADAPAPAAAAGALGRIEAAAARGDFAAATAEVAKLPEALRARVAPWLAKAQARAAALAAAQATVKASLAALGAEGSAPR